MHILAAGAAFRKERPRAEHVERLHSKRAIRWRSNGVVRACGVLCMWVRVGRSVPCDRLCDGRGRTVSGPLRSKANGISNLEVWLMMSFSSDSRAFGFPLTTSVRVEMALRSSRFTAMATRRRHNVRGVYVCGGSGVRWEQASGSEDTHTRQSHVRGTEESGLECLLHELDLPGGVHSRPASERSR